MRHLTLRTAKERYTKYFFHSQPDGGAQRYIFQRLFRHRLQSG
jgi:hypothetical protein